MFYKRWKGSRGIDEHKRREIEAKNRAIRREIEVCLLANNFKLTDDPQIIPQKKSHIENLEESVSSLTKQVISLKESLSQTRAALCTVQKNVSKEISLFGEAFKKDLAETKAELKGKPKKRLKKVHNRNC